MAQLAAAADASVTGPNPRTSDKSAKILAKSLFRDLRANGWDDRQILALSTEIISLLTTEIREDDR